MAGVEERIRHERVAKPEPRFTQSEMAGVVTEHGRHGAIAAPGFEELGALEIGRQDRSRLGVPLSEGERGDAFLGRGHAVDPPGPMLPDPLRDRKSGIALR